MILKRFVRPVRMLMASLTSPKHTMTRKHRRFAQNMSNWAELDALLFEIQRPLKEVYEFDE